MEISSAAILACIVKHTVFELVLALFLAVIPENVFHSTSAVEANFILGSCYFVADIHQAEPVLIVGYLPIMQTTFVRLLPHPNTCQAICKCNTA